MTLLAFGAVIPGYLATEDFYFVPRYVHLPFRETLRAQWLLRTTVDDPMGFLQFYRPLAYMWVHFKVWLWRGWIPGLRLDELLLNAAVSASIGVLAIRWTRDRGVGTIAALLAVAAPAHMRLLTTIWGSNNLWAGLAAAWCMIWMYDAIELQCSGRMTTALLTGLAGILCYEQVLVVPWIAVATAYILHRRPLRTYVRPLGLVAILSAGYLAIRYTLFGGLGGYHTVEGQSWIAVGSWPKLFLQVWDIERIVALSAFTPFQPPVVAWPPIVGEITLGLWGVLALFTWHKRPAFARPTLCALLWIGVTSLPLVGLMPAPHHWATYPFFASLGAVMIAAMVIRSLVSAKAQPIAAGAVILVFLLTTWRGLALWHDTWDETHRFVTQLRQVVPPESTPAFVYVQHLPGTRPEPQHFSFLSPMDHELYTGYLPDRLFLRSADASWPNAFPLSGTRPWPPPAALQLHWLAWDPHNRSLRLLGDQPQPTPGRGIAWDFTLPETLRAWRLAHDLSIPRGVPSASWVVVEGPFPLLTGPELPVGVGTPVYAEVTMAILPPEDGDARSIAEWQFRTVTQPLPSPAHVVRFWVRQDGVSHTYRVPLVSNPRLLLDGRITQLDLRPTGTPGAIVQIHEIAVQPRPTPTDD